MTDDYNSASNYKAEQSYAALESSSLYEQGIRALKLAGFSLVPNLHGAHCGHDVLLRVRPREVAGINYPHHFHCLRKLETEHEEALLVKTIACNAMLDAETQKFWSPLITPKPGTDNSDLRGHVERLHRIQETHRSQNEDQPLHYGVQVANFDETVSAPRAYVPPEEWFDDNVRSLRLGDLLTLWPEAELEMLAIIIGRGLVGPSFTQLLGDKEPIIHTFRSLAIVVGEDPGLGKSTIFNMLFRTISTMGYVRYNFRTTTEQFGLSEVIKSDFAYKDDMTVASLSALIRAENTKTIASSGQMYVEKKFQGGHNAESRTVIICNTNEWDPRAVYGLDAGIVSRVKLLSTFTKNEVPEHKLPFVNIPTLAKDLGVQEQTLMMWVCRLCVNEFLQYVSYRGEVPSTRLATRVASLTTRLRFQFHKDCTREIVTTMSFCSETTALIKGGQYYMPELSINSLREHIRSLRFIMSDAGFHPLKALLKQHWELLDRPENHPWLGIKKLNIFSVKNAEAKLNEAVQVGLPLDEVCKRVFGAFMLRDGFKGSNDIVWVTKAWNTVRKDKCDLAQQFYKLVCTLNETNDLSPMWQARYENLDLQTLDERYIDESGYCPSLITGTLNVKNYTKELFAIRTSASRSLGN